MSSKSNSKNQVIDLNKPYTCSFCQKNFARESTLVSHVCEAKRRHQAKNEPAVKLAMVAFQQFQASLKPGKTVVCTYQEFCASNLYTTFVRIGAWALEHQVQEFNSWVKYLLREAVKLDRWCDVHTYREYLKHLLDSEPADQAIERSLKTMENWGMDTGNPWQDFFRVVNTNVACNWIQSGRISAWMLYNAPSAIHLLERCNQEQLTWIQETAPSRKWRVKFMRYQEESDAIRASLVQAGL